MGPMSFLNALFLGGAALALVPVIIHLVQRRRIQTVVFGSVRFLRKMSQRVVRRRRLTELLLILLRAFALGALAVAFARPFFWQQSQRVGSETILGDEAALILVDNSYSMQAGTRLERAKRRARSWLEQLGPGAKVGVASFATEIQTRSPIGSTLVDARRAIDEIQPSWGGTRLDRVLRDADQRLQRPEERRRLILISDFQQSAWKSPGDWRLAAGTVLSVEDVSEQDVPNVLIDKVVVPRLAVAGGSAEVISARIVNLTDAPLEQATVTFKIGASPVEKRTVNIQPGSEMPVRFRRTFTKPGDTTGSIEVAAADSMPADNVAHFCVHVTPRVRVLLVNGGPSREMVRDDGFFLRMALAPPVQGQSSPFSVKEVTVANFTPEQLSDVDVVILANVGKVSPGVKQGLQAFLDRGGGLCFLCGENTSPDEFNQSLADLAPCRLWRKAVAEDEPPAVITIVDFRHEIFAPFAAPRTGNLALAEFSQYYLVRARQQASVPARFNTGHPALLEVQLGQANRGRSILLPSALDLEWNNFCLKGAVFVPFVHQIAKRLCAEQSTGKRNEIVGSSVHYRLGQQAASAELQPPDGKKRPLTVQPADGAQKVSFTPDRPGIYTVLHGNEQGSFAVNLAEREPDLRRLDTREIVSSVQPSPVSGVKEAVGVRSLVGKQTARQRAESQQSIWWYVIALVVAALAVEMILAARSGTS